MSTAVGLQVRAESPSDLDLCAVHVIVRGVDLPVGAVARSVEAGPQLRSLRAKGYVVRAHARGAAVVASALAPADAASHVAAVLSTAIPAEGIAADPTVDPADFVASVIAGAIDPKRPRASAGEAVAAAARSVVVVAPRAALPQPEQLESFTTAGVETPRGEGVLDDGPLVLTERGGDRCALEVITVLPPVADVTEAFARSLLSVCLAGHHTAIVTSAADAALHGGYDVSSTLDVIDGVDVLRVSVGIRDAALLAAVAEAVADVLARVESLVRAPGVLDAARAHARAAYDASQSSMVSLAEGVTSFIAQGLPPSAFFHASAHLAATTDDHVVAAAAMLSPSRRVIVVSGATGDARDAVRPLLESARGAR